MIDLQKKSGNYFLYDLNVHWAYIFVTPSAIFVLFQLIQINTNLCIFLICLFISFIHIMHDPNDYCFSKMIIKIQEILHYTKFWNNAMLQSEVRQVENENQGVTQILAWMIQDKIHDQKIQWVIIQLFSLHQVKLDLFKLYN